MSWLRKLTEQGKQLSRMGMIPAHENFMKFGGKNDKEAGLHEIWWENGHSNIKWLDEHKDRISTVYDLPKYEGKAIIFCGLGPSMKEQWEELKNLDDRFIIVATNSSAQFLIEHDIIPHYVIAIDGRPGNWTMDLGEKCSNTIAIFSACVEPQALRDWPGKIMIVPLGVDDRSLNMKIRKRYGKSLPSGGNAINNAVIIFQLLTQAKIFMFIGNDLSFSDTYYADRESKNDETGCFFMTDISGGKVKTLIPLYEYKIWLENLMAQLFPEYHFFNCSGGILGIDVDGKLLPFITQSPLKEAVAATKEALDIEASPLDFKLKYIYDSFYDHDFGNQQRGIGIWRFVNTYYGGYKKGIDVGCGRANGVQFARESGFDVYGCDISEAATKCWRERGVIDYCKVAPANKLPYADQEFDMVVCSEVMEHIPEEGTLETLKEIFRIGSDKFLFTISLVPEQLPVAGYIQTHINLHEPKWWFDRFKEAGFQVIGAGHDSKMRGMSILAVRDEDQYRRGEKKLPLNKDGTPLIVVIGDLDDPAEAFFSDGKEVML